MRITIQSSHDLGRVVRAVRQHSKVRLDDLAATAGVSKQFTTDVEHGKSTVRFGLVLKLLSELGIPLELSIPDDAAKSVDSLRGEGGGAQRIRRGRPRVSRPGTDEPGDTKSRR